MSHLDAPIATVIKGDRVVNRITGEAGVVRYTQRPNPPWHYSGVPFVDADDPEESGYWHFYDLEPK